MGAWTGLFSSCFSPFASLIPAPSVHMRYCVTNCAAAIDVNLSNARVLATPIRVLLPRNGPGCVEKRWQRSLPACSYRLLCKACVAGQGDLSLTEWSDAAEGRHPGVTRWHAGALCGAGPRSDDATRSAACAKGGAHRALLSWLIQRRYRVTDRASMYSSHSGESSAIVARTTSSCVTIRRSIISRFVTP